VEHFISGQGHDFSSIALQWRRQKPQGEKPGYPPGWSSGHDGDSYYILKHTPGTKRNSSFRLPARKRRHQLPGLPHRFSPEPPKNLPGLNKTPLKAIFMINEIVTRLVRNLWYYGGKSIAEQI
jgi:hypothetical protein